MSKPETILGGTCLEIQYTPPTRGELLSRGLRHVVDAVTCWPLKSRYGFRSFAAAGEFIELAGFCFKRALLPLLLTCSALLGQSQDSPAFAIEAGVTSPRDPTATFGLIVGAGATRSYSRFAFDADGKARQVETGIERVLLHSKRFDFISRAVAGIVQDENNVSGTVAGSFGLHVPIRWGLSITALGEGANAPVRDGEWRGGASLTVRWVAQ